MWILASPHGMSSPLNQIFSVGVIGIGISSKRRADGVGNLRRRSFSIVGFFDGFLNSGRGFRLAQEIAHHGGRNDRRSGVGLALAGDVGRRAVYRLEQRRAGAGGVQVGGGGPADPARDRPTEVGEDVAEE